MDDLVVLGGVLGPVHMDAIRLGVRLELFQVFIEMDERVLLNLGRKRAQFLPFGNSCASLIALLPQVPQALKPCIFSCSGAAMKRAAASA